MDQSSPPRKLSIADIIGKEAASKDGLAARDPLAQELNKVIDWKAEIAASTKRLNDRQLLEPPQAAIEGMFDPMRETRRRLDASAQAERRTVEVLETMLREAQASKADNVWMFRFTAIAAGASVVGIVVSVAIAIWQKATP